MPFTEFYINSIGSNLNSGSTNLANANFTSDSGNWSTVSLNFKPTDGQNPSGSVNVGDFASIYNTGATETVYLTRISFVQNAVNGNITTLSVNSYGTAPTTNAVNRSMKVGGAWKGPS